MTVGIFTRKLGVSEGAKIWRSRGSSCCCCGLPAGREPRVTGSGETQPPVSLTLCTEPTPELTSQRHLPRLPPATNLVAPALLVGVVPWSACCSIRHPLPAGLLL
ncbi:hypothetical protein NDU88_009988 [Pleurodeles waltl]|uniref:Uncharacterized protein n=1 Tax=Pleurodeles waltl TaxID=8319 RepID=A0AAV7S1Z1_PLEWA|nr:hypothetical protein NDU88_009988 [Pleurodeles waltl]